MPNLVDDMTDNKTGTPQPRRIHPIHRALKPVQDRIGKLNEALAFLGARAQRRLDAAAVAREIGCKRALVAETLALFDAAVGQLPEKYLRDTRLADTRAAITRLTRALERIEAQFELSELPPTPGTPGST